MTPAYRAGRARGARRVFLGLGANLGDREGNLRRAVRQLAARCEIAGVSSLYQSKALVLEGQEPGPDYLNAVCEIETDLSAAGLLNLAKEIEREIGRKPAERWASREIDIDVLLFGDEIIETAELLVPHPGIAERAFVLVPLAEIAAEVVHPVLGRTIGGLADGVDATGLKRVSGRKWAVEAVGGSE